MTRARWSLSVFILLVALLISISAFRQAKTGLAFILVIAGLVALANLVGVRRSR